jgi:hypothetical protein
MEGDAMKRTRLALLMVAVYGLFCASDTLRAQLLPSCVTSAGVGMSFMSPNGATFSSVTSPATGTEINGGSVGLINHMIIDPVIQPNLATNDYTVTAKVYVINPNEEFGVMSRVQTDGRGYLFSIHWGGVNVASLNRPTLGVFSDASTWNPAYILSSDLINNFNLANHEYFLKLQIVGDTLAGKVWDAAQAEPAAWTVTAVDSNHTLPTGTGVGFYNYVDFNSNILESLQVTAPLPDGTCCDLGGGGCHVGDVCQAGTCVNNAASYPGCMTLYNETMVSVQNVTGSSVIPVCSGASTTLSFTDANNLPIAITLPNNTTGPISVTLASAGAPNQSILVQGATLPAGTAKTIVLGGVSTMSSLCVNDAATAQVNTGSTCAAPAQAVPLPSDPLCYCKQYPTGCFCTTVTSCDSPPTTTPTSSNCGIPSGGPTGATDTIGPTALALTEVHSQRAVPFGAATSPAGLGAQRWLDAPATLPLFAALGPVLAADILAAPSTPNATPADPTAVCGALAAVGVGKSICRDSCSGSTCRVVFGGSLNTFVGTVPDADGDGVPNCLDRCPATTNLTGPTPTSGQLLPNHFGDRDLIFGCNADDILACKPGQNVGEHKWGITPGTRHVFESIGTSSPIGWAAACATMYPRAQPCQ